MVDTLPWDKGDKVQLDKVKPFLDKKALMVQALMVQAFHKKVDCKQTHKHQAVVGASLNTYLVVVEQESMKRGLNMVRGLGNWLVGLEEDNLEPNTHVPPRAKVVESSFASEVDTQWDFVVTYKGRMELPLTKRIYWLKCSNNFIMLMNAYFKIRFRNHTK
jgi:hypothetical protein